MKLANSSKFFSAIPVRDLLQNYLNYQPTSHELVIALSLIAGTNEETLKARSQSHLTHSTQIDHQIRFPLKNRILRSIKKLALEVSKIKTELEFEANLLKDDFISVEFFKNLKNVKINYVNNASSDGDLLNSSEKEVLSRLLERPQDIKVIISFVQERIYSGDYRSAFKILKEVESSRHSDTVFYMLGLCCNFFEDFDQARYYFSKMLESSNALSRIKGSYVLSMIYLRMYPKEKQDLSKAEGYLQSAYQDLEQNPEVPDHTFHSVFNRNGFALCLFRRGKIQHALDMLLSGIAKLEANNSGAVHLHRSVLIYNAVQCLRSLERYSESESLCAELIKIDPLFPEYHLENARTLLMQNKYAESLQFIEKAENLDPEIPEVYALKGFALMNLGHFRKAAQLYGRAHALRPVEFQWSLDQAYCLAEAGNIKKVSNVLNTINRRKLNAEQLSQFKSLSLH